MAKTAKVKKRQSTLHSRAARRATSPSLEGNLDKSLKPTSNPHSSPANIAPKPHVLAAKASGIVKKSQKSKPLKRQQRERREKAMQRAEDDMDKMELKVAKSVVKEKKVKERSKGWEEVNAERKRKELRERKGKEKRLQMEEAESENEMNLAYERKMQWPGDLEMDGADSIKEEIDVEGGAVQEPVLEGVGMVKLEVVVPESIPLPQATMEEDEML